MPERSTRSTCEEVDPVGIPISRFVLRRALLKQRSWETCDPDAEPVRGWHVRLNPYELAIFQAACEVDGRTQQRIGRHIIRTWAEQALGVEHMTAVDERLKDVRSQLAVAREEVQELEQLEAALVRGQRL